MPKWIQDNKIKFALKLRHLRHRLHGRIGALDQDQLIDLARIVLGQESEELQEIVELKKEIEDES